MLLKELRKEYTYGHSSLGPNTEAVRSNIRGTIDTITEGIRYDGWLMQGEHGYCIGYEQPKQVTGYATSVRLTGYGQISSSKLRLIELLEQRLGKQLKRC